MSSLLSVVIPVYNGENYIGETVHQILLSSYKNLEILLINDGSTDSSLEICESLEKNDKRIKVYSKKNSGIAATRNYGLDKAKGEYICFVDQDDFVSETMYEESVSRLESDHSDFAICGTGMYLDGEKRIYETFENLAFEGEDIINYLLIPMLFGPYESPWNEKAPKQYSTIWKAVFRSDFLKSKSIRFIKLIDYEDDQTFMAEAYLAATRISTISGTYYYWRINPSSESHSNKYIFNLEKKQENYRKYLHNAFQSGKLPIDYFEYWEALQDNMRLFEYIENECNPTNNLSYIAKAKKIKVKVDYWRKNQKNRKQLTFRKGVIKRKVEYFMISHRLAFIFPFFLPLFLNMEKTVESSNFLSKINRTFKKIRN